MKRSLFFGNSLCSLSLISRDSSSMCSKKSLTITVFGRNSFLWFLPPSGILCQSHLSCIVTQKPTWRWNDRLTSWTRKALDVHKRSSSKWSIQMVSATMILAHVAMRTPLITMMRQTNGVRYALTKMWTSSAIVYNLKSPLNQLQRRHNRKNLMLT